MKPKPPKGLWDKLQDDMVMLAVHVVPKPPDAFTRREFQKQFGLTPGQANRRLGKLQDAGKIVRGGTSGRNVYYTYSES